MSPRAWSLALLFALAPPAAYAAPMTYVSADVPKAISSGPSSTVFSNLFVPDDFIIQSLTVRLSITHTIDGDLDIFLIGPTGIIVELSTDNGGGGDNYSDTVFDDAAGVSITQGTAPFIGTFRPEQPLAAFAGTNAMGQWRLRVTDDTTFGGGSLSSWSLTLTPAVQPVANAGADQTVDEGTVVTLDGSASTGPNLMFAWLQLAGPSVELSDPTSPTPSFTAPPLPGGFGSQVLTFQLTVTSATQSTSDTVDVTIVNVNHAPVAQAGGDQTVNEASPVTLDGSASFDPDGDTITYTWVQTDGASVELSGANTAQPSFTAPLLAGGTGGVVTFTFALTVSDGALSSTDTVQVIVEQVNHAPVANAGADQTRNEGTLVTLDGTGSDDPDADQISFAWRQTDGPPVELSDPHSPTPSFTAPVTGPGGATLVFELTVSDGLLTNESALTEPDERVTINVMNINDPPLCAAARPFPAVLWPPTHKMVPVAILGVAGPDNDQIQIAITGVTQDEPLIGLGAGDTSPDAVILGDFDSDGKILRLLKKWLKVPVVLLRAERSGSGNGRVYRINFTATDSQGTGGSCAGSVSVGVPHSIKPGGVPVDDGQLYDSTLH